MPSPVRKVCLLIETCLPGIKVTIAIKGRVGGGLNEAFVRFSGLKWKPWADLTADRL